MASRSGPPSTAELVIGSLSQYTFDRHEHKPPTHHPEYALRQVFTHTVPDQPLDDRRGETLLVNRVHEPRIKAGPRPEFVSDARDSIRRHYPDAASAKEAVARIALQQERQTLRFKAFFVEDVIGSALEEKRTRVLQIVWYPQTNEMRLFEPHQVNAGIEQGDFLRRSRPVLAGTGREVQLADLCAAGCVLRIETPPLELTVVDADEYTRKWLVAHDMGDFGKAQEVPASYTHPSTKRTHDWTRPTKVAQDRGFETNAALGFYSRAPDVRGRFEQARGRVLRFEGLLDQRRGSAGRAGDLLVVAVHYFLEDETMEVLCPEGLNSGRGTGSAKLLSRQRVPIDAADAAPSSDIPDAPAEMLPAADAALRLRPATAAASSPAFAAAASSAAAPARAVRTAGAASASRRRVGLLTPSEAAAEAREAHARHRSQARYRFSPGSWSGTYVSPVTGQPLYGSGGVDGAMESGARRPPVTHVTPDLLRAGTWITMFGRRIWLRRADAFTAAWYRESMGVEQEALAAEGPVVSAAPRRGREADVAPHEGMAAIGDEEETRRNANKLVPTWRAKPDFTQFFECDGKVLNFHAKLVDPCPQDAGRRFVVSFFLVDNTLSINESHAPNAGRWGVRFLERGKYRNGRAAIVLPPGVSADNTFLDASMRSTIMARERALGGMGDVYGYGHGFGQGYAGGALGKADRTGAGCTGVPSARGIGIRERVPTAPPQRYFEPEDLCIGERFEMAHAPGLAFELFDADSFTKRWLARRGLWSENESGAEVPPPASTPASGNSAAGRIATELSGCLASVRRALLSRDRRDTGTLPLSTVVGVLATYGASPPTVASEDLSAVVSEHLHAADDASDELRVRWAPLCDALVAAGRAAATAGLSATEGTPEEGARIEQQLRSALLSSRSHLRRCFRELGIKVPGAITPAEFRHLLRRHHLDLGMTQDDVVSAMSRYPRASMEEIAEEAAMRGVEPPAADALPPSCISYRGFLWALAGGNSGAASVSDSEVLEIENIVRGISRNLDDGAGPAPEYFPHPPRAAAWGRPRIAWADGTGAGWSADEVSAEDAVAIRDRMRDTVRRDARSDRPSPADTQPPSAEHEAEEPAEPASPAASPSPRDAVVAELGHFFRGKAWELHRTMRLYDPAVRGQMTRRAFVAALTSAGYLLGPSAEEALFGALPADGPVDWRAMVSELTAAAH